MDAESSSSDMAQKLTIGIVSIGEMGLGIAKLLQAHKYAVCTNAAGRSQSTVDRIKSAQIAVLPTDEELVVQADIILSIVPPRDALATARRIIQACKSKNGVSKRRQRRNSVDVDNASPLTYIDLNAVSPKTVATIAALFNSQASPEVGRIHRRSSSFSFLSTPVATIPIPVIFVDGGILGPPPVLQSNGSWKKPSLVLSGPSDSQLNPELSSLLNMKHISPHIGAASALKSCFASLHKGFTAISLLAYTTASNSGILSHLQSELTHHNPAFAAFAEKSLTSFPPKAYRWVEEMRQIGETFSEVGGFGDGLGGKAMFEGASEIYKLVAEDTELGGEKTEVRKRGRSVEDVVKCMQEGMHKKKTKTGDNLDLEWRSSWS